jgi:hypothetical protein
LAARSNLGHGNYSPASAFTHYDSIGGVSPKSQIHELSSRRLAEHHAIGLYERDAPFDDLEVTLTKVTGQKMSMPRFTAATSFYKTGGYYQTSRHAISVPTQMIRGMLEIIEVHDCPPGHLAFGEGENMTCVPVRSFPGHEGPNTTQD